MKTPFGSLTETPGSHVGGHQDVALPVTELPQHKVALLLALVAMHANSLPAIPPDVTCNALDFFLGFDEDEGFCTWFGVVTNFLQKVV